MRISYRGSNKNEFGLGDNIRAAMIDGTKKEENKMDALYNILKEKGYNPGYEGDTEGLVIEIDVHDREEYEEFKSVYKELKKIL